MGNCRSRVYLGHKWRDLLSWGLRSSYAMGCMRTDEVNRFGATGLKMFLDCIYFL